MSVRCGSVLLCLPFLWTLGAAQEDTPDSLRNKDAKLIVIPVIAYTPETKLVLGAAGFYYFNTSDLSPLTSAARLLGAYTTRQQYKAQLNSDVYLNDGRDKVTFEVSFTKFVDSFWGIGPATPESAEEHYTTRRTILFVRPQTTVAQNLQAGLLFDFEQQTIVETDAGSSLSSGLIAGSGGGTFSGIGVVLNYDSRDQVFSPTAGNYTELIWTEFPRFLGSDFKFSSVVVDSRLFLPVAEASVTALQMYGRFTGGNVPFQRLSALGGPNRMRGLFEGRFRDRHMLEVQAEYRFPLFGRFGAAAFIAAGDVAPAVGKFSLRSIKFAGGFGGRYAINKDDKVNLRLDIAIAKDAVNTYFTIEEAF